MASAGGDDFNDPVGDGELEEENNTDIPAPAPDDSPSIKNLEKEKGGVEKLKSRIVVSGVVIAVIGAIFAVAKKIKEASK